MQFFTCAIYILTGGQFHMLLLIGPNDKIKKLNQRLSKLTMEQLATLSIEDKFEEDLCEEDEELIQKALPVSGNSLPNRPPATGEEYLRMVRSEANKRPNVVIAKNQINKSKEVRMAGWVKRGWANQMELDNFDQNSNNLVNEEWEKIFLMKFDLIRQVGYHSIRFPNLYMNSITTKTLILYVTLLQLTRVLNLLNFVIVNLLF